MTRPTKHRFNHQQIWQIAFPMMISNISTPLLGLVDTAVMGHLNSASYLGAVALGGVIFTFIYWGFGFLRMGATGVAAQAYGNNDYDEIRAIIGRSFFLATTISILVLLLQNPIKLFGFYLIESSEIVEKQASRYVGIRIWSTPATLGSYILIGVFLGLQNAKTPLLFIILTNFCNIALDIVFVVILKMDINGIALATVIFEYLGFIVGLILLHSKLKKHPGRWDLNLIKNTTNLKKMLLTNNNIFIRTLCLIFTFAFFTAQSAKFGELILAANSILLQFQVFIAYALDGFAHAAESLVGKAIGSRDNSLLRKTIKTTMLWSVSVAVIFSLAYLFFGQELINLLTDIEPVRREAYRYLPWVVAPPPIAVWCYLLDGIFIGATLSKEMRDMMLFSTMFFFFPVWYMTQPLENNGLWLTVIIFLLARGISMGWICKRRLCL